MFIYIWLIVMFASVVLTLGVVFGTIEVRDWSSWIFVTICFDVYHFFWICISKDDLLIVIIYSEAAQDIENSIAA